MTIEKWGRDSDHEVNATDSMECKRGTGVYLAMNPFII